MNILVLNAGSSSLKFSLYRLDGDGDSPREQVLANGILDRIGSDQASLKLSIGGVSREDRSLRAASPGEAVEHVINQLTASDIVDEAPAQIDAVGHRIVHGGERFTQPTRIDAAVIEEIRSLTELAPLHNPAGLAGIETCLRMLPAAPSVAVFDTAFHHDMPDVAARYALPQELNEQMGLRRFGFHGISYRYVSQRLLACLKRDRAGTRLVICHLGNGASVCALRDGRSVDTSMGYTPMEGLIMGTRCGDVDPGLILSLLHRTGKTADDMERLLNQRSGLLGLSGRSSDVRDLEEAAASGDARSELALACFAYRTRKYIGAYAAALGGLDALAFTAGIGEHSAQMRWRICEGLEFVGIHLDRERNQTAIGAEPREISTPGCNVSVWVVPTNEDLQIAREAYSLLSSSSTR